MCDIICNDTFLEMRSNSMKVAFVTDSGTGKSIHEYAEQGILCKSA